MKVFFSGFLSLVMCLFLTTVCLPSPGISIGSRAASSLREGYFLFLLSVSIAGPSREPDAYSGATLSCFGNGYLSRRLQASFVKYVIERFVGLFQQVYWK